MSVEKISAENAEAAREKFAAVIADWLRREGDELAKMRAEVDDDYAFEKLRRMAEDVSRMDIRYYGKLKID